MIQSWIMNVIEPRLHKGVAYVDSAQKLWENIKKGYPVANVPKIHKLKVEIASHQQNGHQVIEFFPSLWAFGLN